MSCECVYESRHFFVCLPPKHSYSQWAHLSTSSYPFLSSAGRITCGVCISHKVLLSSVRTTTCISPPEPSESVSDRTSFTVAFERTPRTAAPCRDASSTTASTSCGVTSGRAESWTATKSASSFTTRRPLRTESWRSRPGRANSSGGGHAFRVGERFRRRRCRIPAENVFVRFVADHDNLTNARQVHEDLQRVQRHWFPTELEKLLWH